MTKPHINVWPRDACIADGWATRSAIIELPGHKPCELWYQAAERWGNTFSESADCFAIATTFLAMRRGLPLFVHGPVSPSLLENIDEFQAIWNCWRPSIYSQVELRAEIEQEATPAADDSAVACYSGGVDGAFTILRHVRKSAGRRSRGVGAALLIQGFDIPLREEDHFERNRQNSEKVLASLGIPVLAMRTNWRSLGVHWEDGHGTAFGACLHLLGRQFRFGLLGSSDTYKQPHCPWGSSPLSDPYLSSGSFRIINDGAAFTRVEKVREIGTWQELLPYLRVCWEGTAYDRNCGQCEKCIRTILDFRVVGAGLPPSFKADASDAMIEAVPIRNTVERNRYQAILAEAEKAGMGSDRWARILRRRIARYDRMALAPKWLSAVYRRLQRFARARRPIRSCEKPEMTCGCES